MARLAIEFDKQQIYLAAMQSASGRIQIKHLASLQHEASDEAAISALTDEVASAGLSKSDTVVVVSRADVELRLLDVPPAPENELPAMVRFVAKNEFASLNDSWLLDFVRLSGDENVPGKVLAAGLAPERKERIQKTVEAAGLRLKNIAFRPLAVAGYLSSYLKDKGSRVLIECDHGSANITLFDGHSMFATRNIRLAGNDLAGVLQREIKRTIAVADKTSDQLDEILLLGPTETVTPLGATLSGALGTEHQVIDPAKDRSVSKELGAVDQSHRFVPLLGTYSDSEATPSMDFLNPRKVEVKKTDYSKWYLYGGIAAAVLFLLFGVGYLRLRDQANRIAVREEKLLKITNINFGATARPAVDLTMNQVGKIDQWVTDGINWQDTLLAFSEHALTPDDTIIDSMNASQKGSTQLVIRARVATTEKESNLVKSLQKRADFVTTQKGSKPLNDPEFSIESKLEIALQQDAKKQLPAINKRAEAFINKQRAARAAAANTNTSSN